MTGNDTVGRRELGRELRKLRKSAGLTQSDAAQALNCGQGKINKIEMTLVRIDIAELDKLLELYAADDDKAESLRDLAARLPVGRRGASVLPRSSSYEELTDREPDARAIYNWHCERIPVSLRSEQYTLRHLGDQQRTPRSVVVEMLRRRKARAEVLFGDRSLDYQVILSESSLRRMPGGFSPELTVDQMEHMARLVEDSARLTLRVLPFDAPLPYVDSDFVLLRFVQADTDFAYIEYPGGARKISSSGELLGFAEHWEQLKSAALGPEESLNFILNVAEDARARWPVDKL